MVQDWIDFDEHARALRNEATSSDVVYLLNMQVDEMALAYAELLAERNSLVAALQSKCEALMRVALERDRVRHHLVREILGARSNEWTTEAASRVVAERDAAMRLASAPVVNDVTATQTTLVGVAPSAGENAAPYDAAFFNRHRP